MGPLFHEENSGLILFVDLILMIMPVLFALTTTQKIKWCKVVRAFPVNNSILKPKSCICD